MGYQYIDLNNQAFILINGPLIFVSLTVNIFYACCLICNKQRLKQPLKMLLGFLVWCSIMYCVSLTLLHCDVNGTLSDDMLLAVWMIVMYYVHTSMTCSVWLNFYYYIQIVPGQRALLLWVKKNIKSVMYVILLFDGTFLLFCNTIAVAESIYHSRAGTYINGTWTQAQNYGLDYTSTVCIFLIKVYILLCLLIMTVSSFSTAHYLHRHIRSVARGGGFSSTPRIQSQIRVTISGISQGVLYFLYITFYFVDSFTCMFSPDFEFSISVSFTVTSLYISGTTVNLGIGQTIFRQRAASVWRALKALCGIVTTDVKMQSTSGEIANTVTVDVQMSL